MENVNQNPLFKHFRQPAIYIRLPSQGKYWGENGLELPLNGEIPVYPMTTQDEIALRTPDALMNGNGVVTVIQSCCPNIKNAWLAPSIDMDTLLIAVRIASYGNNMEVETSCPKCQTNNKYSIDLNKALESIRAPDYETPVEINGLHFKFQPQEYKETNKTNTFNYEEQRILAALNDANLEPEEKSRVIAEQMKKLGDMTVGLLAKSTEYIKTDDAQIVKNSEYIEEFYRNAESKLIRQLQEKIEVFAKDTSVKPYQVVCENCRHEFEMSVNFDYSSFFAVGF